MRATVIIPTRGRTQTIQGALRSLLDTDPGRFDCEIVVVDNNDHEGVSSDLRVACGAAGEPVRYLAEPSPGQSAARHRGAREARGELLIYIDDDVQVSPGWLEAYLASFEDKTVGIAGGPSIPMFGGSIPAWLWDFWQPTPYGGWSCGWLSLLDIGRSVDDIDPVWIWGLNLAIRRDVLHRLGGFHPDLVPPALQRWQGDGETGLAYKAKAAGVRSVYLNDALLHHQIGCDRLTVDAFAKRAYYQGICDSFTRIRAGAAPSASAPGPRTPPPPDQAGSTWTRTAYDTRLRTASAYNEGWTYHQREAAADQSLLEWIRRPSYWDSDIRAEMQKACGPP